MGISAKEQIEIRSDQFAEAAAMNMDIWVSLDASRAKAGGWWRDVKTIRVRKADDVLPDDVYLVMELGVRNGEIVSIRMLQRGQYYEPFKTGPFMLWTLEEFLPWFMHESDIDEKGKAKSYREVWMSGETWARNQAALVKVNEAFT